MTKASVSAEAGQGSLPSFDGTGNRIVLTLLGLMLAFAGAGIGSALLLRPAPAQGAYSPARVEAAPAVYAALPTLTWLQERGAKVTACSHLGRPKGAPDPKYSMDPVRARLAELAPGVELLENLRFDPRETSKDAAGDSFRYLLQPNLLLR